MLREPIDAGLPADRMTQQRKTEQTSKVSDASAKTVVRPAAIGLMSPVSFHAIVFSVAFLIVCSHRPDAVLNAQFYAEDGRDWYPAAYRFGLHSFLMPEAGYLHTLIRTVALFALLFPFSLAPLVMNLCAIVVQILPVNMFLSSRFSNIALPTRLLAAFLYLALPTTYEIDANITNVQWHLALLACLLLLARPASGAGWRIFDGSVLVLTSFTTAIGILLVPVAAVSWWKRRQWWSAISFALLIPGALVEALVALFSHTRQVAPNGATFPRFVAILGWKVLLSSLLGPSTQFLLVRLDAIPLIELIAAVVGLALLLYALRFGRTELKLFILFAFAVLALGLVNPLAGPPDRPQWEWLCIPGCGDRYYFLSMLAFLASLFWMASRRTSPRALQYFAVALLLLLPIGIYQDWKYPPLQDLHFPWYAAKFEDAPANTKIIIPINPPGWSMELTKH